MAAAALKPKPLPGKPAPEGDTLDAFLRAATSLVNEQGAYFGASVNRISARLNLIKGAIYHHQTVSAHRGRHVR